MKKIVLYSCSLILPAFFYSSCTKELPEPPKNFISAADLVGEWNAYGYFDKSGHVALEVVKVELKNDTLWATKLVGDQTVRTGKVAWYGAYKGNPFKVGWPVFAYGKLIYFPQDMLVENVNELKCKGVVFYRRTDPFKP